MGRTDWDTGKKEVLLPKIDFMNRFETFFNLILNTRVIDFADLQEPMFLWGE